MFKNLISLLLTLSLSLLYFSSNMIISIHPFNHTDVKNNIEFLSSDYFKGRLAGTTENIEAAAYIKNQFKKNNLKPFYSSYFQSFKYYYPEKVSGTPYLTINDHNNNLIKEYVYCKDFKEDMLNFKNNSASFSKKQDLLFKNNLLKVKTTTDEFIFYVPDDNNLQFRSSFYKDSKSSMFIIITKDTLSEIKNYINEGLSVNCFIPYKISNTTLNNVTAVIKGKNSNKSPIIISAHFDHVGCDLAGNIYNGALDNASGISFIIEMSEYLNSLGTPDRDILFIGFNAEEFGCIGSKAFVNKYKPIIKHSKVYNFDMIGSNNSVPLCIMGGEKDTSNSTLVKSASSTCSKEHIYFNYLFGDSSDHEFFRKENIDAITFIDNDVSRIHTPKDKASFISTNNIDRCFSVTSKEIIKHAFNDNPLFIYYKQIFGVSSVAVLLFIFLYYKKC